MKGGRAKITAEQRRLVVEMARERYPIDGGWVHRYQDIAEAFGIRRCYVSLLSRRAGLPSRSPGRRCGEQNTVPSELQAMYEDIRPKVGCREAKRLIREHIMARLQKAGTQNGATASV